MKRFIIHQPGTSKKLSGDFLRRHQARAIAGTAKRRAAPAATPPAIAPVALLPKIFTRLKVEMLNLSLEAISKT